MIEKILLVFLLATCASASNFEKFLARIKNERNFADNPCSGRSGSHFARNYRGCSWYYACNSENEVIREDRCPDGLR